MTDIMPKDEVQKLLDDKSQGLFVPKDRFNSLARSLLAAHDEIDRLRADAQAAVALVVRDAVHEALGWKAAAAAILVGAALSWTFAAPGLVLASVAAFVIGEAMDLAVFANIRRRSIALAILASGLIGAAADSAVFLWLAFGSLDYIAGQVLGKFYATAVVAAFFFIKERTRDAGV